MQTMIVMVCGIRDGETIRQVSALGADWIGLVFSDQSPRNVPLVSVGAGIMPDRVPSGFSPATSDVPQPEAFSGASVGIFYDEMPQNIITRVVNFQLDVVLFGGHETPTLMRNLRQTLDPDIRKGIRFVKTISVSDAESLGACGDYADCTDFFLFDLQDSLQGGQADWSLLSDYDGERPFLIGPVSPDDAERVRGFRHPRFAGICLDAHFETEPGVIDIDLTKRFLERLRKPVFYGITS